jgi:hypothetical protein
MDEIVTVRSQLWVKALIVIGVPFLGWAGSYTIWLSIASGFNPLLKNLFLCGAGIFCVIVVLKGLPLLRFLQHSLILRTDGIEVAKGKMAKFFKWEQVGAIKASDTFNILSIYDRNGKLVYAVDYYAENFRQFTEQLNELSSRKP